MKHAGRQAIESLEPLLEALRLRPGLREKRPAIFYLKSRAFVHFHEDPAGLFADVKLSENFTRFPVNTDRQRQLVIKRIDRALAKGR